MLSSLKVLNISANDITAEGIGSLIGLLNHGKIKILNLSKNILGDDGIIELINCLKDVEAGTIIEKIDVSSCKISDKGFMHFLENINSLA